MKKTALFVLVCLFAGTALASAAEPGTPEYDQLKAYKKAQREKRDAEKTNPAAAEKGFWQKEAERSGLAGTGAMLSNGFFDATHIDRPNSRKA